MLAFSTLRSFHPKRSDAQARQCQFGLSQGTLFARLLDSGRRSTVNAMTGREFDKLNRRREQIVMTLRHLEREQKQVEQNTDWLDQAAYKSRVDLLDRLWAGYVTEIDQIDSAIERIKKNKYGFCIGCRQPIEKGRLEASPEAAFCSACQKMRDEFTTL
jgi:RNA polymerase-binding transcription factor DksA